MLRHRQRSEDETPSIISFRATPEQQRKIEMLASTMKGNKSAALAALVDSAIVVVVDNAQPQGK